MWISTKLKRRPFPLNLAALRACRVSYSQFGEDLFLTHLLGYEKTDGVFVDVGCYQPIVLSNTYIFYQRGWRGLAIDPNPQFKAAWDRYRPGDLFLNFAVSKARGRMTYLINSQYPAMNTVVDEDKISGFDSTQYTVGSCEAIPLSDILDRYLNGNRIDLLNVDCEGRDVEVLETNDFEKYRPAVIAMEDTNLSSDTKANQLLQALGYEYRAYIGLTKIFQDKK
jgi:FkbM family methyltransferase